MKRARIWALFIVLFLVQTTFLAVLFYTSAVYVPRNAAAAKSVFVEIPAGSSVAQIGEILQKKSVITSKGVFSLYTRFSGKGTRLIPGTYLLSAKLNIPQILSLLASGKVAARRVTVPEGYTVAKIALLWQADGFGSSADFLTAAAKTYTYSFLPPPNQTVRYQIEGYLAPATYEVLINAKPDDFIRQMLLAYKLQVIPKVVISNQTQFKTANEVITLASIVEREANDSESRHHVAGVFLNRLRLDIPLQSDVTVNYATGRSGTLPADTLIASPYNTYKVAALPPGPICSPSSDSIDAVLHPASTDDIYFLAGSDGQIYYAKTLTEHNQNIRLHLK